MNALSVVIADQTAPAFPDGGALSNHCAAAV
jgi:hypothetical protein